MYGIGIGIGSDGDPDRDGGVEMDWEDFKTLRECESAWETKKIVYLSNYRSNKTFILVDVSRKDGHSYTNAHTWTHAYQHLEIQAQK